MKAAGIPGTRYHAGWPTRSGMRTSKKGTEYEDIYYNEAAQQMVVVWFARDVMA